MANNTSATNQKSIDQSKKFAEDWLTVENILKIF